MIQVLFRPLEALTPVHLALLACLESPKSTMQLSFDLSIPQMIVDHSIEDLASWELTESNSGEFRLTQRGARCIAVWTVTDKRGFWIFEDGAKWLLGKGTFFFRRPLESLRDAGLNPETGVVVSERDAKIKLKKFHSAKLQIDSGIETGKLRESIIRAFEKRQDINLVVKEGLSGAQTRQQLSQLCRLALSALDDVQKSIAEAKNHERKDIVEGTRITVERLRREIERAIREYESEIHTATQVLLAAWLADREGLLKDVAETDPNTLLVRSECGDFAWMDLPLDAYDRPDNSDDSLIVAFGKLIASFFK